MKIIAKFSRAKVIAGTEHNLDLLVKLRAPAPATKGTRTPLCIVPVVDVSGSMQGNKLAAVQKALNQLVAHLVPGDHFALVAFDSDVQTLSPVVEVTEARKVEILALIRGLRAGSSTNLAGGLMQGVRLVRDAKLPPGLRARVVLLTDGNANAGPATTAADLAALVRDHAGGVPLSAFGYGNDCDQSLLADIAGTGGGSYAYIKNDDAVMTAFAREIGGLLATYATQIKVRVLPLGTGAADETVADLLYHGEQAAFFNVTVPARLESVGAEAGAVELTWTDGRGGVQTTRLVLRLDHVTADKVDTVDDPDVARACDEKRLRQAQERAEVHAHQGEFALARQTIEDVIAKLRDVALVAFARSVLLACYAGESEYGGTAGVRASARSALSRQRQVLAYGAVAACFNIVPSAAEADMELSFRSVGKGQAGAKKKAKTS